MVWDYRKQDTYRVNVQYLKSPFTVEELRSTFGHTDPEQSTYLKESGNDIREGEDMGKGDNVSKDRKDDYGTRSPNQTSWAQAPPSTTHDARPQGAIATTPLPAIPCFSSISLFSSQINSVTRLCLFSRTLR
eukprot:TRINITY_DN17967_c0_g1_i1.p1 TRINITY_DN17967_c0_g1~~TRINITY_DN17967_c0_g1_i1.p1  ORF type:complete len:132 (+),score=11.56 TRINITY_DN17967_c0_g1_i1:17-412(+)